MCAAPGSAIQPTAPWRGMPATNPRRGAGVVDRDGLENRCACKRTVGSNPTPSANDFPANDDEMARLATVG